MSEEKKSTEAPMTLRLPKPWHESLRQLAFERRTTKTELIKQALRQTYGFVDPEENSA